MTRKQQTKETKKKKEKLFFLIAGHCPTSDEALVVLILPNSGVKFTELCTGNPADDTARQSQF